MSVYDRVSVFMIVCLCVWFVMCVLLLEEAGNACACVRA